ncbi:MAG: PadR family transcriptional regulator [Chloroflexi bacterium]|nr:PadR family transcriptional regulator [Chloroflexota bacterium]
MPRHRRGWAMESGFQGQGRGRHSPLAVSLLEPALLVLLHDQARHGYPLLADLEKWGMGSIHPSVVYRTLRDMEELEWIQSTWDVDETQGPPRRVYRLTERGAEVLKNWREEMKSIRELLSELISKTDKV